MAHLRSSLALATLLACSSLFASSAFAGDLKLTGAQEVPPNASAAVGTDGARAAEDETP